jgi:hypothetical protein
MGSISGTATFITVRLETFRAMVLLGKPTASSKYALDMEEETKRNC